MATKPAPAVKEFPADSIEKKVYGLVDSLEEYLPIPNDRYRLSFGLLKYLNKEGDVPEILVKSTKVQIKGISPDELAVKLTEKIKEIK
ncbi:MAG: hypothetical protein KKA84_02840 [Bacteroidetes bacterium]|nr:hypothetical protein [Bacteroidota bacterium]